MRVLSVVHGAEARAELFASVVEEQGHRLDESSFSAGAAPPSPEAYDAVLVFGGAMHPDQDFRHPWLRAEAAWLRKLLDDGTPVLGVCLGAQLLARAAGAVVGPLPEPEIGWCEVELTDAGLRDPLLGELPRRFTALQWHRYTYGVPAGAVELARSPACSQAFRLGDRSWGVQFHPEVTGAQLERWCGDTSDPPPDAERLLAETPRHIGRWNELGRALCSAFLGAAERSLDRAA